MADSFDTKTKVYSELGDTGLKRWSGYVSEEFLAKLKGQQGVRLYAEMAQNHPVIGGMLHVIRTLTRNVKWKIEEADSTPAEVEKADFVRSCMDDMKQSWSETITDMLTTVVFGYVVLELVYGPRDGKEFKDDNGVSTGWRSRYKDGKIGWRKISLRSHDTLQRWEFTPKGEVLGIWQQPFTGGISFIPITKCIHIRMPGLKDNPEGQSLLRNAAVPYLIQKNLIDIENIGIERDMTGVPILKVPSRILSLEATADELAIKNALKEMLRNLKRNESEGIMLPSDQVNGVPAYSFELVTSGGSRQVNTNEIIQRWDQRIAMTMLADFLLLGQQAVGSFALASSKTALFSTSLGGILDQIAEAFTRDAIPRLLELNGFETDTVPTLKHGDVENIDPQELVNYLTGLSSAGMPLFPDPALEDHLRDVMNLPKADAMSDRQVGTGEGDVDSEEQAAAAGEQEPTPEDDNEEDKVPPSKEE